MMHAANIAPRLVTLSAVLWIALGFTSARAEPGSPYCMAMNAVAALTPVAETMAEDDTHYKRNTSYRHDIMRAHAALRAAGPAPTGAPSSSLLALQIRAHNDIVQTAEIMGLDAAFSALRATDFIARNEAIQEGILALACTPPGWREKLAWLILPIQPILRLWEIERLRPIMLWSLCFAMIVWARRHRIREDNTPTLHIIDRRDEGRVRCNLPATLLIGAETLQVRVLDLSRQGCRFAISRETDLPEFAHLNLPAAIGRHTRLIRQNNQIGVVLLVPPLSETELGEVLAQDELPASLNAVGKEKGRRPVGPAPELT